MKCLTTQLLETRIPYSMRASNILRGKQLRRLHCVEYTDTSVLFDYIDLYTKYMCLHDAQQCLATAIIPPIQEQVKVVQSFNNILHDVGRVHDLQGVILKLIINHDDKALDALTTTLEQYNNNIDVIHAIVDYTRDSSLPSNDLTSTTM